MTLVLEKRGCNFLPAEGWCKGHREDKSDVGNYRVGSYDYSIIGKDGIKDLYIQGNGHNFENSFDIFFLTREEAEKALKERESNG